MLLGFILVPKFVKFIQVLYMYIFIYICIYLQGAKFSPSLCLLPTPKTCLALTFVKSGSDRISSRISHFLVAIILEKVLV